MDENLGVNDLEMDEFVTSTPFENSVRRETFIVSKEDKENEIWRTRRKGARKKWNPDLPVVLPPWVEKDGDDCTSSEDKILFTSAKPSTTFIVSKENSAVPIEEAKLKNKILCNKAFGNQGPVNITNNVFTKQNDKKDGRRSAQVVSRENKKKIEQRRSLDVRKVAANPTSVAGLPQRRLKLKKSTTSVKLREPLPYASKNTLYDEHWSYKQERAFTKWLNYILAPLDCYGNTIPTKGKKVNNTGQLQFMEQDPVNLTKVPISPFHSCRREARLQQSACLLYQSSSLEDVFLKLEVEVETRRLSMRLDQTIYSDVGLRQQLIDLLNSYNAAWLRLAVEVLFGEVLPIHTAGGELVDFGAYCVRRLCENDDISRAYTCKIGTHGAGYEEALLKFAYRKLLMMIIFLDMAKMGRLMDNDPCLFVKTSDVKSSKQVLLSLSHLFLCGEGDVVKHLRLLGYTLHHIQRPLDEYDYTVINLATDLRDGIRLCRLIEMLTNKWELSQQMRVPATGKTQKLHNVDAVLKMLRQHISFPQLVTAQTIVQGHRELTLSLLWSIIFHFKVDLQLDQDELRKEIERLKGQNQHPIARTNFCQRRASLEGSIFFQSSTISLLLQWCQAVCAIYGVTVTNFSTSFCDGRVFCYIIHHYHPSLLPLESIKNETSLTAVPPPPVEEPVIDGFEKNWTRSFSPTTNKEKTEIIGNEKANFKLLSEKMLLLGGVPPIVMSKDMVDTIPDEKVVITYTSYLCKQLLSISNEVRASMVIQHAWRRHHAKIELKKRLMKRDMAAVLIQAHVRRYLAQVSYHRIRKAVAVIQHHWRAHCEMLQQREHYLLIHQAVLVIQHQFRAYREARRHRAAQKIQAHIRGYLQFCRYERLKHAAQVIQLAYREHLAALEAEEARRQCAAVRIQSYWRKCMHQRSYLKFKHTCTIIQQRYRAKVLADEARKVFKAKRSATVTIQAAFKSFRAHKMFLTWKHAAIIIQQWYRSVVVSRKVRSDYQKTVRCVCIVQLCVKEWFNQRSLAATTLQASIRGYIQRCRYIRMREAIITIQQRYRAHQAMVQCRQHYCQLKSSCIVIQAAVKAWRGQQRYKQMQSAAVKIQSWYKGQLVRQRYVKMKKACSTIACHWRAVILGRVQRLVYLNLYSKIVRLQAAVRGWLCRKWVGLFHSSAAVIQKAYREHLSRRHQAATKMQATFRAYHARQLFLTLKQATSVIQVRYRALKKGRKLQKEYRQTCASIIVIQAMCRGHLAHKNYIQLKMATLAIQANWRRCKEQRRYNVTREAILCIQQWYRWAHQGRLARQSYLRLKSAAITIQRGFVEYRRKKQLIAAVKIQSVVRCLLARKKYLQIIRASVTIQAFIRGYLVRSHIRSLTNAVTKVEMYYKAKLVGRKVQGEYQQIRGACILLQSAYRGWKVRHYVVKLQMAVQMVEEVWLAQQQRKQYLHLKQSTVIIQQWYRSVLLTRQVHTQYLLIKSAALVIQSFMRGQVARKLYRSHCAARKIQSYYRGYKARSQLLRIQNACVTIQSWIRRYCDRKNYLTMRAAALTIQSRIRALRCGKDARSKYLQLTNAAILIQATYKAKKQRCDFLELKEKTVTIQARRRMCVVRRQYLNIRRAALTLQAYIRSHLLTKAINNDYKMLREAAVTVQCYTRTHQHRTKYLQLRQAAVTIQSTLRMYQCRKLYQEKKAAVLALQRHTRALLLGREVRYCYIAMRDSAMVIQRAYREHRATRRYRAAVTIQSHYRRYMAQKRYRMLRTATISIQRLRRVKQCQKHYQKLQQAALIIQSRVRALCCGRDARSKYLQLTNAAILIQATYKARKQKCTFAELKQKAIYIQAQFRMCIVRRQYLNIRTAALALQAHMRSHLLTKAISNDYRMLREAAVTVQCYTRAHQQRTKYLQLRQAAVTIQSTLRMYQCRKLYQEKKAAVLVLQRHTRALLLGREVRSCYIAMKDSAMVIQRAYREHRATRRYRATVAIQSHCRRYMALKRYNSWRTATITIQQCWRGRKCYECYQKLRQATLTIQSRVRALRCGRDARSKYLKLTNAAILIQATYKAKKQRCVFLELKEKAIVIQAQYRMCVVRRQYLNIRRAALTLQAYMRSYLLTKAISNDYRMLRETAVIVQCYTRAHQRRTKYLQLRQATVTIQSTLRMYQCRKLYQEKKAAALVLQGHTRALLLGRRVRFAYTTLREAAIVIQRAYHEHRATRRYHAAVTIQSYYRRYMAQKIYNSLQSAAITIQRYWRGWCCFVNYNRMKTAALCLQRSYRVHALRVKIHQEIERKIRAAILIQAVYRGHMIYSKFTRVHWATLTIQSHFRRVRAQEEFNHIRNSVIFIQHKWRATLLARSIHAEFEAQQKAALIIQQYYRGYQLTKKTRYQYMSLWTASVTLQKAIRQYLTYRRQQKLMAATCIQRAYRDYKRTVEIKRRVEFVKQFSYLALMHLSAILIQRSWRCYQHKLLEQRRHLAAIKLQVWYRMMVTRRRYTKLLSSVITVQQLCRHQIESIQQRKLHHCAIIIQACWRGYCVRCQMGSQIEEIRNRIKRASLEERQRVTLRDQMPGLLQLLMKGKYLSHGSYVLEKLELITRLSDGCSLVLVEAGALPVLYDVINGTNRNRASLLLVETTLQILLNLTKWSCTSPDVLQHNGFVSTIVCMMQKIYFSQSDIMQHCCQLLYVYCNQQDVKLVQNHLGPEVRRLHNMATTLRDKLLILGKKWQRKAMTPLIQQQHEQFQSSLSSLERVLGTSAISKCKC